MKEMESEIEKLIKVWVSAILGLCYCYYIASRIPKGFLRFFSLIPIIYLFITLPFKISSPNLVGYTSFFLVWLGTFKLLLFSFNHGPLALSPPNILHFISIASLPITPKQHPPPTKQNKPKWLLPLKALLFATIARAYDYNQHLHPHFLLLLYCCHLYLGLEVIFAIVATPVQIISGFQIESQFDEPCLSTSLQDFWGHRWNLMVSRILRPSIYGPVRRMSTPFMGPFYAMLVAMFATFLVSGLMHELIYYYVIRVPPTWEITCFFVLHGVCTVAEVAVKKVALRRGWRLHRVISGLLVVAFLSVTANWLFFPQLLRNGMDQKSSEEYAVLINFFKSRLPLLDVFNSPK
ncbi:alginate biosynthesis protein AlgI [Vigna unguiculata]|uniref:Alginate biosynthesis protein AlgI n=1 Tax=Vigna unguiculata TaxID=3917 RepID=A0A4D6KX52_VIGUN|nr:alginate biosynthesis protein AlgI [Vigna unguiculata]